MGRSPGRWGPEGAHWRHRAGPGGDRGGDHHRVPRTPWIRNVVPEGDDRTWRGMEEHLREAEPRYTRGSARRGHRERTCSTPGWGAAELPGGRAGRVLGEHPVREQEAAPRGASREQGEAYLSRGDSAGEGLQSGAPAATSPAYAAKADEKYMGRGAERRTRGTSGDGYGDGSRGAPVGAVSNAVEDVLPGVAEEGPAGGDRRDEGSGDRDVRRRYRERAGTCTPAPRRREVHRLPVPGAETTRIAYRGYRGLEGM